MTSNMTNDTCGINGTSEPFQGSLAQTGPPTRGGYPGLQFANTFGVIPSRESLVEKKYWFAHSLI